MTDIPEHLLRRSKERRAALGGGGDAPAGADAGPTPSAAPAPAAAGSSAAPAKAAAAAKAAPAVLEAPAPPPIPPGRAKIPIWVMPVLLALPIFAFLYAQGYNPPPPPVPTDPLVLGAQIYRSAGCSGCHGTAGEGGVGPQLSEGNAAKTFPDIKDHYAWVKSGSGPFAGQGYGDPNREGGQHIAKGGMPAFAQLSEEEVEAVVAYEREKL